MIPGRSPNARPDPTPNPGPDAARPGEPTALDSERRVRAAIAGDAEALRRVWIEHRRWVAGVLLAHKPREVDLEDLLQDVAMTLVRRVSELRDESAFRPWLRTVAINAAQAALRKAKVRRRDASERKERAASAGGVEPRPGADAALADREHASRLLELARELPEGYREPLLLRSIRGLSYQRIGEIMSLPETTIETRITRARRMLRELSGVSRASVAAAGAGGPSTKEGVS